MTRRTLEVMDSIHSRIPLLLAASAKHISQARSFDKESQWFSYRRILDKPIQYDEVSTSHHGIPTSGVFYSCWALPPARCPSLCVESAATSRVRFDNVATEIIVAIVLEALDSRARLYVCAGSERGTTTYPASEAAITRRIGGPAFPDDNDGRSAVFGGRNSSSGRCSEVSPSKDNN